MGITLNKITEISQNQFVGFLSLREVKTLLDGGYITFFIPHFQIKS
jgi:hypothetical protein